MAPLLNRRATRPRPISVLAPALFLACCVACSAPEEARTYVSLRAFDSDGEPLPRVRVRFRDAAERPVGFGELHYGNGFRFESAQLGEHGDWGRRVRTADIETDTCSSVNDRIALREESLRVAVGGHPSLRSKKITRYDLRATVVCLRPLSDERRRRVERALREGSVRSRVRAAVELGWLRAPEDASQQLKEAMQDSSAIALGIVHIPKPSVVSALIAVLDDDRERVRVAAAVLLARLGRN